MSMFAEWLEFMRDTTCSEYKISPTSGVDFLIFPYNRKRISWRLSAVLTGFFVSQNPMTAAQQGLAVGINATNVAGASLLLDGDMVTRQLHGFLIATGQVLTVWEVTSNRN